MSKFSDETRDNSSASKKKQAQSNPSFAKELSPQAPPHNVPPANQPKPRG